jgi:hypothetical protein
MRVHPYFRVLPRVRLYVAKPLRAGCISSTSVGVLILGALVWLFAIIGVRSLFGQVDGVLQFHGVDAQFNVANPTAKPLKVSITLFKDSTLADSIPARISPKQFTLAVGGSQVVRIRLRAKMQAGAAYRLATTFLPTEEPAPPRATVRLTLATRMIVRVKAGP